MRRMALIAVLLVAVSGTAGARTGTWFDEIVFFEESNQAKVLSEMETGDVHFFGTSFEPGLYGDVLNSGLPRTTSYGTATEYVLNHATFSGGRLNPFSISAIRSACNLLIDRAFLVGTLCRGRAMARATIVDPFGPVYAEIAAAARDIELQSTHDEAQAIAIIDGEMRKAGAVKGPSGYWTLGGEPVVVTGLIRVEDERLASGDHFAAQLEKAGFVVQRTYGTIETILPIYVDSARSDGLWSFYTNGFVMSGVDREETSRYADAFASIPWMLRTGCYEAMLALDRGEFTDVFDRAGLRATCEACADEAAPRIRLYSEVATWGWAGDADVAADLKAGAFGDLWPHTMSLVDVDGAPIVGGTIRVASPAVHVTPWNPMDGAAWAYDRQIITGTQDLPFIRHPHTGIAMPMWADRATVTVCEGLNVSASEPWCVLNVVPEIVVPGNAWAEWDALSQEFVPVSTLYPDGLTSDVSVEIQYPADLFQRYWHDGSRFALADCLLALIVALDRVEPESAYYDESALPIEAGFRAFEIVQPNPLITRVYLDGVHLEAESIVLANDHYAWPVYGAGPAPWHSLAVGLKSEADELCAFSSAKAATLGVLQMDYVAGPSLEVLKGALAEAAVEALIPFEPTLGNYVTLSDAVQRYSDLTSYVETFGHLWVGNGPLRLQHVDTIAGIIVGETFPSYPYDSNRWMGLGDPRLAEATVSGPFTVTVGDEAIFDVSVTDLRGAPYPAADLEGAVVLLVDAEGNVVHEGEGTILGNGLIRAVLPPDVTALLVEGPTQIECIVTVKPVAIPARAEMEFSALY